MISSAERRCGIFRAAWRFALHLLYFQMLLLLWLGAGARGGWLAARMGVQLGGLPDLAAAGIGVGIGIACFLLLRPLADRLQVVQINSCWPICANLRAASPPLSMRRSMLTRRVSSPPRAARKPIEIIVVGHSAAGVTACAVMARAFELDPDVGRRGPQIVFADARVGDAGGPRSIRPRRKCATLIARLATAPSADLDRLACRARTL